MLNVAFYLDATAARAPGATAVVYKGRRYSYAQLHRLANQVANGLAAAGYGAGDRLAVCCSNRPGFIPVYYGILKTGATAVVLSDTLSPRDLAYELEDSEAKALFVYDRKEDLAIGEDAAGIARLAPACDDLWVIPADPLAPSTIADCAALSDLIDGQATDFGTVGFDESETAIVLYTSGSTGRPKGVEITQGNLTAMVMLNLLLAEREATRVRLVVAAMYDVMGQVFSLNLPVLSGETMVLVETFEPEETWRLIEAEGVSYMAEMPIYYRRLLDHADRVDARRVRATLRLCATGGAALPAAWSAEFEDRFGAPLSPGYGMTEATSTVTWNSPAHEIRPDTAGRTIPGVELRILDRDGSPLPPGSFGKIVVRSPGVMKGYLHHPEETARALRDGWLHTNDIGALDQDGYLHIQGRADGMITQGDEHIYPAEIANILQRHPAVARAAVKGIPHDTLGQQARAYVTLRDDRAIDDEDLLDWLTGELPKDRAPGHLQVVPSLPLTRNGKIAYHLLS